MPSDSPSPEKARPSSKQEARRALPAALLALGSVAGAASFVWKQANPAPLVTPTPVPTGTPAPRNEDEERRKDQLVKTQAALDSAPQIHILTTDSEFPDKKREVWKEGNRFRDETAERVSLYDGKRRWLWLKKSNLVRTWTDFPDEKILPVSGGGGGGVADYLTDISKKKSLRFGVLLRKGKPIAENGSGPSESTLMLASDNDLPLQEKQVSRRRVPRGKPAGGGAMGLGGGAGRSAGAPQAVQNVVESILRYDEKPPATAFELPPALAAKAVDLNARQNEWHALVRKTTLATIQQGTGACTVRHLAVGSRGEIFVLYTGNWPDGHATLDASGKSVLAPRHEIADDQKRRYYRLTAGIGVNSSLFYDNWLTDVVQMRAAEPGALPIQLAILSPLQVVTSPAKKLVFAEGKTVTELPLPAPIAAELPEYLSLLEPDATLALGREKAIQQCVLGAPKAIREGRPATEVVEEAESLIRRMKEKPSWEILLKLGQANEAAGRRDAALNHLMKAQELFLSVPGNGKNVPPEIKASLDRLAP